MTNSELAKLRDYKVLCGCVYKHDNSIGLLIKKDEDYKQIMLTLPSYRAEASANLLGVDLKTMLNSDTCNFIAFEEDNLMSDDKRGHDEYNATSGYYGSPTVTGYALKNNLFYIAKNNTIGINKSVHWISAYSLYEQLDDENVKEILSKRYDFATLKTLTEQMAIQDTFENEFDEID